MLQNAKIQFFNADMNAEKLCYTSKVTFGDDGLPSGDLRKMSMADHKKMVEEGLKSYKREVKYVPIDLFQKVMQHLACADLALSAAHYKKHVLVGRSGVGRRTLVSLVLATYDDKEWKRDFKQDMQMTGIERQHNQSARRTLEQVKQRRVSPRLG